jgi:transposase-like protein
MRRGKWSGEQKMAMVLEGIKGEESIAQLCRQHGIAQGQFYRWRDQFLEGGKKGLSNNGSNASGQAQSLKAKIKELERIIGRLTIANEILKKTKN